MANKSKGLPKSFVFPNDANTYLNSRGHIKLNTSLNLIFEIDMVSWMWYFVNLAYIPYAVVSLKGFQYHNLYGCKAL